MNLHRVVKNKNVAYKLNALILYYKDYTYAQIEDALLLDERTVRRYRYLYMNEGIEGLVRNNHKGGFSKLSAEQEEQFHKDLEEILFNTAAEVCRHVKQKYGIDYTPEGMVITLHRLGFSYKKTKHVPSRANKEKQEEFLESYKKLREELKWRIRSKPATDSGLKLPGIPVESCHPIRIYPATF